MLDSVRPDSGEKGRWRLFATSARGVTLLELLLVIFILAGMTAGGVYMVGLLTHGQLKDEARRLSTAIQYTNYQAGLNNRHYRMIIDLDSNTYYTELTDTEVIIDDTSEEAEEAYDDGMLPEELRQLEAEQEAERGGVFNDEEHDPFGVSRRVGYQSADDAVIETRALEHGVVFHSVRTEARPRPVEQGRVAIRFFSNGLQQEAVIVLEDPSSGARYTLVTEPMTGRVRTYSGDYDADEDFGPEVYDG